MVLVPRETPLSLIHLRNMTAVTEAGAIVLPASPGFYHRPRSVQDLVDAVAGRILHHLGAGSGLMQAWRGIDAADELGQGLGVTRDGIYRLARLHARTPSQRPVAAS